MLFLLKLPLFYPFGSLNVPPEGQVGEHVGKHDYFYLHIFHCAAVQLEFL